MKKVAAIVCAALLCLSILAGCTRVQKVDTNEDKAFSMFIEVEETASWHIVYHKETKVMYAVSYGSYNLGTFTLLVNADGTPMIYGE